MHDTEQTPPTVPARPRRHAVDKKLVAGYVALALAAGTVAASVLVPVPFIIEQPGPTFDTLGDQDGTPLVTVEGAPTYPTSGELLMTTVSTVGGPGYPATAGDVVFGIIDPERAVVPREAVYPPAVSEESVSKANKAQMTGSQDTASTAALTELGYPMQTAAEVVAIEPDGPADGVLAEFDIITVVDGVEVSTVKELKATLAEVPGGSTIPLTVRRDGADVEVEAVTGTAEDGSSKLGITVADKKTFPVTVSYHLEDVGGPSAGTMFALAIIDMLTPEDETGGNVIAGTGTMDDEGTVGPIGGIAQKMVGARNAGATWFLAPKSNCDEVNGHIPDGLDVVAVSTLHEAREAVEAVGQGEGATLSGCR